MRCLLPELLQNSDVFEIALGGFGGPVTQAAQALEQALTISPRDEQGALVLADAVLAKACGWSRLLPVLAIGLRHADLRTEGQALGLACHDAVVAAAREILPLAADLARRAEHLLQVAPKLRAKASDAALSRFLSQDALAPSLALTDLMSDRAARRLCERLVALKAVREFTGRDSFRLYGL